MITYRKYSIEEIEKARDHVRTIARQDWADSVKDRYVEMCLQTYLMCGVTLEELAARAAVDQKWLDEMEEVDDKEAGLFQPDSNVTSYCTSTGRTIGE